MTVGRIEKKPVAFRIVITGVCDVDYEVGVECPAEALRDEMSRNLMMSRSVCELMYEGQDVEIDFQTDDSRNLPDDLGGYLMPEMQGDVAVVCDCGRTSFDSDGCCVSCGQHASEIGA